MLITDDHMHLYKYKREKALEEFKKAGGTHVFLVTLLSKHYGIFPRKGDDFRQMFDTHIKLVEKANKIVKAYAVLGVHPAEITILGEKLGYKVAADIMKDALDIAGNYVEMGKAVAIKSGRPHYRVSEEVWRLSNEVMLHAFKVAKDVGCAVQLHTESFSRKSIEEIARIARKAGIKLYRVVKHFSPPAIDVFEEVGIFPSVIAMGDNVLKAAITGDRYTVETDYIDDPNRPGAVLGPKTVPKKVKELLKMGYSEDFVMKICKDNIEKIYGIDMD
jgi:TatD-related deoxyribonuclease